MSGTINDRLNDFEERIKNAEQGLVTLIRKVEMVNDIMVVVNNILVEQGVIGIEDFKKRFQEVADARVKNLEKLKDELSKIQDSEEKGEMKTYDEWADSFESERGVKYDREWYKTQRPDYADYHMGRKEAAIIFFQNPQITEEGAVI